MKLNSNKFNFSFFLSDRVKVNNLSEAAKKYGGATYNKDTGEMYSNIEGSEYIELKQGRELNTLSLFIPSTVDVDKAANTEELKRVISSMVQRIHRKYEEVPTIEKGIGTWYSDDLQQVVYDNLYIMSVHREEVTEHDIRFFISLARHIKREMRQENVTLTINTALALI